MAVKKVKKEFAVTVAEKRCKGCGICIELCPKKVLELAYPQMKCRVVRIQDCIGCLMCELHCPDFAILCKPKEITPAAPDEKPAARGKGA